MRVRRHSAGRINLKAVIIIVVVVVALVGAAFVARHVRRAALSKRDLAAGLSAYDRGDWAVARRHLQEYLGRRPDDTGVLRKFAESVLQTEPLTPGGVMLAAAAYRDLLRLLPDDAEAARKLAELYTYLGSLSELAYVAERRLAREPTDIQAQIWLARSLIGRREFDQAQKLLLPLTRRLEDRPEKHPECVEAYRMLSMVAHSKGSEEASGEALDWLDRAVAYDPASAEARIYRAMAYRTTRPPPGRSREDMLKTAREDLQQTETIATEDPRVALTLSQEWMHHGELERAQRMLESVRQVDRGVVKEHCIAAEDWAVAWFLQAAELSLRRRKPADVRPAAEKLLADITARSHRLAVLPVAVRLDLADGQADKARAHLNEYLDLVKVLQLKGTADRSAVLQSMVASAEGNPDEIIRHLGPLAARGGMGPGAARLLAGTYSQVGRPNDAARVLDDHLKRYPQDGDMWLLLALQHQRLRQWTEALNAARKSEAQGGDAALIRIEAGIHVAVEGIAPDRKALEALAGELAALRKAHPSETRIVLFQAMADSALGGPEAAVDRLRKATEDLGRPLELELALAQTLWQGGQTDQALKSAAGACGRHGRSRQAWALLAGLHQAAGNHVEAMAALQDGLAAVDEADRQHLARGLAVLELRRGDREDGLKRLRDLAEQDPRDVASRSLLLSLLDVVEDAELAERLLEQIRQVRGEEDVLWRQNRARLWLAGEGWRNQREDVIKTLEKWMIEDPQQSFPALMLARLHLRLGQARRAEDVCRRALSLNPAAAEVAEFLVALLGRQGRNAETARVLEGLEAPSQKAASLRLRVAMAEGDLEAPMQELTLRTASNPRDVSARILLARLVYQRTRDGARALQYLDQAAAIRPDSTTVAWLRAVILKTEGRTEQARGVLDSLAKESGTFAAYHLRASFLGEIGDLEAAEKDYKHLTTLEPRATGYQMLASFYEGQGRAHDVVDTLEEGLQAGCDDASLQLRLVHLLLRRGGTDDLRRADTLLSPLEERLGEKPDILYARAVLMMAQGGGDGRRRGLAFLDRLVRIEPGYLPAYFALIQVAVREGDPIRAKALAVRGLEAAPNHADLLLAQAWAERNLRNHDAAAALARKVLQGQAHHVGAIDTLASIAIDSKKPEALSEALTLAREAARERPEEHRPGLRGLPRRRRGSCRGPLPRGARGRAAQRTCSQRPGVDSRRDSQGLPGGAAPGRQGREACTE